MAIFQLPADSAHLQRGQFTLDPAYDHTEDRYRIEVDDDDFTMDGDANMDSVGDDANQLATVYDMDGNVVASGPIYFSEYAMIQSSGGTNYYIDRLEIDGQHMGYVPSDPLTPGESYTYVGGGGANESHFYYEDNSVPCFGPDTSICTPLGQRAIQSIRPGDMVMTRDAGAQPVIWTGTFPVTRADPSLRAVQIADAVPGNSQPYVPLIVSAPHRMFLSDPWFDLIGKGDEVLCMARTLGEPAPPVASWHHLLLAEHHVILANGLWTESLFAAVRSLADCRDPSKPRPRPR